MTMVAERAVAPPMPEHATEPAGPIGPWDRIRAHVRTPLHGAGYALIANAVGTSVLGLAFWAVAARSSTEAAVGATGALLAAMRLISHIADVGMRTGLVRFLPALRERARSVVVGTYAVSGGVAAIAATVFVLLHGRWFEDLSLLDRPAGALLFISGCSVWVVFVLQDSVLIGLRRSTWVPVENAVYGAVKLALLIALIGIYPTWGIYLAWMAPLPFIVVGLAAVILGRELPRLARRPARERVGLRDVARYAVGDYGGSLLWHATLELMPLMVLAVAGVEDAAYYTLAATVAMSLYLIPSAVGYAFVAEAAHDPASAAVNLRRAARQSLMLVVPGAVVVIVAAPLILGILGPSYRAEATPLLRLLAASAVPQVATALAVNLHRARRDVAAVVRLYSAVFVSVLGLGLVLTASLGATGAGYAWFLAQMALATALLATTLRDMWLSAVPTRLLRTVAGPARRVAGRRAASQVRHRLAPLIGAAHDGPDDLAPEIEVLKVAGDQAVVRVGAENGPGPVIKATWSGTTETLRRREHHVLQRLHGDGRLREFRPFVPRPGAHLSDGEIVAFAEANVAGRTGDELIAAGRRHGFLDASTTTMHELYRATASLAAIDRAHVQVWIDEPAARVAAALPEVADSIEQLATELREALIGRIVATSHVHGDLHPGNVIMHERIDEVVGVIDWVDAQGGALPELDAITLAVASRADEECVEFGDLIARLATGSPDPDLEGMLQALPTAEANRGIPRRALLLLAWLHHVAGNLASGTEGRVWVLRNVLAPLDRLVEHVDAGDRPVTDTTVEVAGSPTVSGHPAERAIAADVEEPSGAPATSAVTVPRAGGSSTVGTSGRTSTPTGRALLALTALLGPALWLAGCLQVDVRTIGGLGLIAELPIVAFIGLALVVLGFTSALIDDRAPEPWLAAHLAGLVAMLYAAPVIAYGTIRYAWAWKHVGVVDYIFRFGSVDPTIPVGDVYHNWPGFFTAAEVLSEATGVDPLTIARWAPVFFAFAIASAVWFVLDGLTDDRRLVWSGTWFAVLINWVGQEYFSPQAMAYLLYLVAVGLVLRLDTDRRQSWAMTGAVVAVIAAIASSHQLTPVMLTVALTGLAVTGRRSAAQMALIAGVLSVGWAIWVAAPFVGPELGEEVGALGALFGNAGDTLIDTRSASASQAMVALVGRGAVLVALTLAGIGVLRAWRSSEPLRQPLWLLLAPAFIVAFNDFGGEILFRALMFASPFLGLFAARALSAGSTGGRGRTGVAFGLATTLLVGGFLVAHFGKDGFYVFSPEEVAAATFIAENAPAGSLLVEGSRNYPTQFRNYEFFRYVPIEREDDATRARIARDPVAVLGDWLTDPDDTDAFVLITRSQKLEMEALGIGPPGLLDRIERQLLASADFDLVFENRDATVFAAAERAR